MVYGKPEMKYYLIVVMGLITLTLRANASESRETKVHSEVRDSSEEGWTREVNGIRMRLWAITMDSDGIVTYKVTFRVRPEGASRLPPLQLFSIRFFTVTGKQYKSTMEEGILFNKEFRKSGGELSVFMSILRLPPKVVFLRAEVEELDLYLETFRLLPSEP